MIQSKANTCHNAQRRQHLKQKKLKQCFEIKLKMYWWQRRQPTIIWAKEGNKEETNTQRTTAWARYEIKMQTKHTLKSRSTNQLREMIRMIVDENMKIRKIPSRYNPSVGDPQCGLLTFIILSGSSSWCNWIENIFIAQTFRVLERLINPIL